MRQHISYYLGYYKHYKKQLTLSLMLSLAQAFSLFPIAMIIQYLFDDVLANKDTNMLASGIALSAVLILISTLISLKNRSIALKMIKGIIFEIREKLLHKAIFLNSAYYTSEDLEKMQTEIVQDTERLDNMTAALLTQLLPGFFIVTCVSGILIYLNLSLFFLMLISIPVLYIAGKRMGKKLKASINLFHQDFSEFSKGVSFVLKYSDLIKISSAEKHELSRQKQILTKLRSSSKNVAWVASAYNTIQGNLFLVGTIIVLLFGGMQVIGGMATVGSLISFYVLLNIISANVRTIIGAYPIIIEGLASIDSLMPILNNENYEHWGQKEVEFKDSITIKKVDFGYDEHILLSDLEVEIKKHQVVGVYGKSGTGKSTLIKLIMGIYTPNKGEILIDGVNIKELDIHQYRKKISLLTQEPLFFPGTIKENLLYGIENSNEQSLIEICKKCKIHDFIISLPQGYDSDMGNSGKKLSGGQKQRLAIARALIRDPEILILDEPDNNLDRETIIEIIETIRTLRITTIVISHDPSILPEADQTLRL